MYKCREDINKNELNNNSYYGRVTGDEEMFEVKGNDKSKACSFKQVDSLMAVAKQPQYYRLHFLTVHGMVLWSPILAFKSGLARYANLSLGNPWRCEGGA